MKRSYETIADPSPPPITYVVSVRICTLPGLEYFIWKALAVSTRYQTPWMRVHDRTNRKIDSRKHRSGRRTTKREKQSGLFAECDVRALQFSTDRFFAREKGDEKDGDVAQNVDRFLRVKPGPRSLPDFCLILQPAHSSPASPPPSLRFFFHREGPTRN